nr:hypothetical protein [Snodgrassella alvi]
MAAKQYAYQKNQPGKRISLQHKLPVAAQNNINNTGKDDWYWLTYASAGVPMAFSCGFLFINFTLTGYQSCHQQYGYNNRICIQNTNCVCSGSSVIMGIPPVSIA